MKRAHLIANSKSGKGKGASLAEEAQTICDEFGFELVVYKCETSDDFDKQSVRAVEAAEKDGGVVIAAGGDGTIRGVAQAAHGRNVKFAAVPCGTFNYFARTHGIPEDHLEAFRVALSGEPKPVRLGDINGNIFLINASLGLYAKSIREREEVTSRFGRNRLVAILSTMKSLLSDRNNLTVDLVSGDQKKTVRTPTIFIGNNALQLRNLAMAVAQCFKMDYLAMAVLKPVSIPEKIRIIFRGILKTIDNEQRLETFCVSEMTIKTRRHVNEVALDGELFYLRSPLQVKALTGALNLMKPMPKADT